MQNLVSKSQFKAKALEYLRTVQETKKPLVVTHDGKPVVQVVPYKGGKTRDILKQLRGTVLKYEKPTEPVGLEDWEALK